MCSKAGICVKRPADGSPDAPPKPDLPKPKPDLPKPDLPKPKPDMPKPDLPKPKPDMPKPDMPKPDMPKPDMSKPDMHNPCSGALFDGKMFKGDTKFVSSLGGAKVHLKIAKIGTSNSKPAAWIDIDVSPSTVINQGKSAMSKQGLIVFVPVIKNVGTVSLWWARVCVLLPLP